MILLQPFSPTYQKFLKSPIKSLKNVAKVAAVYIFVYMMAIFFFLQSGARVSFDGEKSPVEAESTLHSPVERGSVQQLRQWIDSYEEAVTNHYSPELRARILAIKVNGVHSDLKLPTNLPATPKCRTSLLPNGLKVCNFSFIRHKWGISGCASALLRFAL